MSHFGFLCPPFAGHLNPMQALAGALAARGHAVTFLGLPGVGGLLTDSRFAFAAYEPGPGVPDLPSLTRHMTQPRGLGLLRILRDGAAMADLVCRQAPALIRARNIDALVVDQLEPAGGIVAAGMGLPFVSVANALLVNREDGVPPPFVGWSYDPSEHGLWRNRGAYRVSDRLMSGLGRVLARHAAAFGRPEQVPTLESCLSPLAQITQTVPGFDFPRNALPSIVHHCGPLRKPEEAGDLSFSRDDRRPMVFASLGTLQGGRLDVFRVIAQVCHALDLKLVIAHGGRLSEKQIAQLPGQPIVRSFVPQRALLRHATLAITNGGLNTVLDALARNVPVIAIPIAFEQAAIAARLAFHGAGVALPLRKLSVATLQRAVTGILQDASFGTNAVAIGTEIALAGGAERAAAIIEAATLKRSASRAGAVA